MCFMTDSERDKKEQKKQQQERKEKTLYAATLAAILANFRMPTKGRRRFGGINCKATNGSQQKQQQQQPQ